MSLSLLTSEGPPKQKKYFSHCNIIELNNWCRLNNSTVDCKVIGFTGYSVAVQFVDGSISVVSPEQLSVYSKAVNEYLNSKRYK